jgi:hypothetical protein
LWSMAGYFLPGLSRALAAFRAIGAGGGDGFGPEGPQQRRGWSPGNYFASRCKAGWPALAFRKSPAFERAIPAAENSCRAPFQTGSGRRLFG